jgi:hypothetical protein
LKRARGLFTAKHCEAVQKTVWEAQLSNHQDAGSRGVIAIAVAGILVSLIVLFSIYRYFERGEGDAYFASQENLTFQEIVAVKNLRRQIAEEFVSGVVNCIDPPLLPGQVLTEQQVSEIVTTAIENYSASNNTNNRKCQNKNSYWTFETPCSIKIIKSPLGLSDAVKLGGLTICKTPIIASIHSGLDHCKASTTSNSLLECLVNSIMENNDIKNEIDKSVEISR